MQAPCLQFIAAGRINDYVLPDGWLICAAINDAADGYHVEALDDAMLSRFSKVKVIPGAAEWAWWAANNGIHSRVIEFVSASPKIFDDPEANPRAWSKASRFLKAWETNGRDPEIAEAALIGQITRGESPGDRREDLEPLDSGAGRLDWREILGRHLRAAIEVQPAYHRPPRRFPHLIGRVPGRLRRPDRPRVLAAIDTSGSIGPDDLAAIGAELERLSRGHEVTVVECDAAIQAAYRYRARIASVGGRGGTDLRPPLKEKFLARFAADVVVYFTDGAGPAPRRPPRVPVIWCLTASGSRPASWGQEVRMG